MTDEPHQMDVDAFCAWCNKTWNIDYEDVRSNRDDEPLDEHLREMIIKYQKAREELGLD